jgi:hypothetical protein
MLKVGKFSCRAPQSFGISGVLLEGGKVYYESCFGTQHVGRISDLICACLHDLNLDELRIRALLLFSVFEGVRSRLEFGAVSSRAEPLTIECGIDS